MTKRLCKMRPRWPQLLMSLRVCCAFLKYQEHRRHMQRVLSHTCLPPWNVTQRVHCEAGQVGVRSAVR
eukprot:7335504-Pyramimonas_sp.AAC.1